MPVQSLFCHITVPIVYLCVVLNLALFLCIWVMLDGVQLCVFVVLLLFLSRLQHVKPFGYKLSGNGSETAAMT